MCFKRPLRNRRGGTSHSPSTSLGAGRPATRWTVELRSHGVEVTITGRTPDILFRFLLIHTLSYSFSVIRWVT